MRKIKKVAVIIFCMLLNTINFSQGYEVKGVDSTASSEENISYDYSINNDDTIRIYGVTIKGEVSEIIIPEKIEEKIVTEVDIDFESYENNYGETAFNNTLKIQIPSGVTYFQMDGILEKCNNLKECIVDKDNKNYKSENGILFDIDGKTIYRYPAGKTDKTYDIPNEVEIIRYSAFYNCKNLDEINIAEGVKSIGDGAFGYCSNLKEAKIPKSVTYIGNAFYGCENIEEILIDSNNQNYKAIDGVLFSKDETQLITYPSGKKDLSYQIPNSVINIGSYAFEGCSSLEKIEIPDSVYDIDDGAFENCSSLKSIKLPDGVTVIEYSIFKGCSNLKDVDLPDNLIEIFNYAFSGCRSLEKIEIPDSVLSIEHRAFEECSSLKNVNLSDNLKTIDSYAFSGCRSLEKIEIPDSVYEIDGVVFEDCSSLKSIKLSNSITRIGYSTFKGCSSLEEIEIPASVTSIGDFAFEECSSLEQIEIPEGVTSIGWGTFKGCSSLEEIEIPASVTSIVEFAFYGCDLLTIYGYSGSYAEEYANQEGIPFISIISLKSDDNIVLEYPENMMGTDICLSTKLLIDEDDEYKNIILENKLVDSSINPSDVKFTAYDINLLDSNNNKVQPNGYVTVKIPCPNGYVGENCKVYRVNDDDTFTDMEVIYEDEMLVFKTNHFSKYIILITAPNYLPGDSDGDGEVTSADAVLMKKYLAGYSDLDISEEASDVDGDGEITSADAVLLLRYLAGYDVELK